MMHGGFINNFQYPEPEIVGRAISKSILKSPEETVPVPACPAQARIDSVAPSTPKSCGRGIPKMH